MIAWLADSPQYGFDELRLDGPDGQVIGTAVLWLHRAMLLQHQSDWRHCL
ncbi:MAG: hypothetical protein IPO25_22720 [Saprospiraceae bacterium]|nr:hypothetical protein [Saprospiraceae bacterium]